MRKPMNYLELRKLLKENERSQAWLSRKLNCSANAVKKWHNDQMPISRLRSDEIRRIFR